MALWAFKDFITTTDTNHVKDWYLERLTLGQQSDLEALIENLGKSKHWGMPDFRWLGDGLGEVRLKAKPPIRLIGCKGKERAFVFLIGCTHKDNRYDPHSALETAKKRKKDCEQNRGRVIDHDYSNYETTEEG